MPLTPQGEFSFKHANQPDTPSVPAATLKAQWDSQASELKATLNKLIADLEKTTSTSGAEQIGSAPISGVAGGNVYAQLVALKALLDATVTGDIPDGTITDAKLSVAAGQILARFAVHEADKANPHEVTKTQVGLGNVTDDAQLPLGGGTMFGKLNANLGIGFQGGDFSEGSISSDANWGCWIYPNNGAIADIVLTDSTNTIVLSIKNGVLTIANQLYKGTGSPEGVVSAAVGAIFQRTDGGASTAMYVKESGTGNTGWIAK